MFWILTMLGSLFAQTVELPPYLDPRLSRQLFEQEFPALLQTQTLKLKHPVNVFVNDNWLYAAGKRIVKFSCVASSSHLFVSVTLLLNKKKCSPICRFYEQPGVVLMPLIDNAFAGDVIKICPGRLTACENKLKTA